MVNSLFEDSLMLAADNHGDDGLAALLGNGNTANTSTGPQILRHVAGDGRDGQQYALTWAFLGCEESFGYGPMDHTAQLFLDLLRQAAEFVAPHAHWMLAIHVFDAKQEPSQDKASMASDYTCVTDWKQTYQGVILPGSYSSAYEQGVPWMERLKTFINTVLIPQQIPTLGICFGHQIMAQATGGQVTKVMTRDAPNQPNPRAGRVTLQTTAAGQGLLGGQRQLDFFVTHGDQVVQLPHSAVALGGDDDVPIQAAAYYATTTTPNDTTTPSSSNGQQQRPFAITFQAHLEYGTSVDLGLYRTVEMIMDQMQQRGDLTREQQAQLRDDARQHFESVHRQSVETMVLVGQELGWFPVLQVAGAGQQ